MTVRPPIQLTFKDVTTTIQYSELEAIISSVAARAKEEDVFEMARITAERLGPLIKLHERYHGWKPSEEWSEQQLFLMPDTPVEATFGSDVFKDVYRDGKFLKQQLGGRLSSPGRIDLFNQFITWSEPVRTDTDLVRLDILAVVLSSKVDDSLVTLTLPRPIVWENTQLVNYDHPVRGLTSNNIYPELGLRVDVDLDLQRARMWFDVSLDHPLHIQYDVYGFVPMITVLKAPASE